MLAPFRDFCSTCITSKHRPGAVFCPTCGRQIALVPRVPVACDRDWGMTGKPRVTVIQWLVPDLRIVNVGQPICEVESEKANLEVVSPGYGLLRQALREGETRNDLALVGWVFLMRRLPEIR